MKVFVTGATGFIGSYVCKELVRAGHSVAILVRDPKHWRIQDFVASVDLVVGDLSDASTYSDALSVWRPDAIIHLAWLGVGGGDRNDIRQISNIQWSAELVQAALLAGARIVLGIGSQAEYGPKSSIVSVDASNEPTTLYGESKLATYRLSKSICDQLNGRFAWIRVFSTYGPGDSPRWMIPGLIGKLLNGEKPPLTMGDQMWDFVHVADAARAIRTVLESEDGVGVFNLGSGSAPSLRSTITAVRDSIDPNLELGWGEIPYRPDQVMLLQADTARLNSLGWGPKVPLHQGLSDTVDWYSQNRWIYGFE